MAAGSREGCIPGIDAYYPPGFNGYFYAKPEQLPDWGRASSPNWTCATRALNAHWRTRSTAERLW
jgi:hypothetical protein